MSKERDRERHARLAGLADDPLELGLEAVAVEQAGERIGPRRLGEPAEQAPLALAHHEHHRADEPSGGDGAQVDVTADEVVTVKKSATSSVAASQTTVTTVHRRPRKYAANTTGQT